MKTQTQTLQTETAIIPAEWAPQSCVWTAWPSHADLWQDDLHPARDEVAAMIMAIAMSGQMVKVLAAGDEACASTKTLLAHGNVEIIPARFGDIWLRDTGPIFNAAGQALRFKNNGWGGKYTLPHDDSIGDFVANEAGMAPLPHDFILEGGAVEHNGTGVILTTRQCVLNPNRNPHWDEATAEAALKEAFGAHRVCWLDEGLMNDHTDGHIDNVARFINKNHVLCQAAYGNGDPNAVLYEKTAQDLKAMGFAVTQIPSPGKVTDANGEIMPASHMNFLITNHLVLVPTYNTPSADTAVAAIADAFPDRRVIGLPSSAILTGGGSFHCITQQEPAR